MVDKRAQGHGVGAEGTGGEWGYCGVFLCFCDSGGSRFMAGVCG